MQYAKHFERWGQTVDVVRDIAVGFKTDGIDRYTAAVERVPTSRPLDLRLHESRV